MLATKKNFSVQFPFHCRVNDSKLYPALSFYHYSIAYHPCVNVNGSMLMQTELWCWFVGLLAQIGMHWNIENEENIYKVSGMELGKAHASVICSTN